MLKPTSSIRSDEIRQTFLDFLRERGIRNTHARRVILDVALELREHFEAEQLIYALRERGERVGKATVYRTLPLLVAAGILKQVSLGTRQAHYERAIGDDPHDHLVCRRCGLIIEFAAREVIDLCERLARPHAFRVSGHRLRLFGLCRDCVERERKT